MALAIRSCVLATLLGIGVAGCTPAAFVQHARPAPACDIQICTNLGTGMARCDCKTRERLAEETRRGFWPHTQ